MLEADLVPHTTRTAADMTMVKMVVLAEAADRMQEQVVVVVIPAAAAIGLILEMAEVAVPTILDLTRVVMQETTLITARS